MGSTTGTWLTLLFVAVVFPIFFTALWIGITYLMSLIGGWGRVAERYPAGDSPPEGAILKKVTGMFGMARYRGVLTVVTTDEGLHIDIRKVFRVGHPPLFIPFSAIQGARRQTLFFWEYVAFDVGEPALAGVRLPSKVFAGTPVDIAP